jgi:hypothetical protein
MAVAAATVRWLVLLLAVSAAATASREKWWHGAGGEASGGGHLVQKEWRRVVAASDAGLVTAVDVADAAGTAYRLHFITMSPGTLFLPVQLHADMVFYVHSGGYYYYVGSYCFPSINKHMSTLTMKLMASFS